MSLAISRVLSLSLFLIVCGPAAAGGGQMIWLDFDSGSSPASPDHAYTAAERAAVEAGLSAIFAPFGHQITSTDPAPAMTTKVLFNDGGVGTSTAVDFRNLITTIDLAATDAGFALDFFGKPRTSENIVQASINLAAHELGHVLGARHHDAYNPVGAGGGGVGTSSTFQSLTTVLGIDGDRIVDPDLYLSPRAAMKLAFADQGTVIPEMEPNNAPPFEVQPIMLSPVEVPNTLPPSDPLSGVPLTALAAVVTGELKPAMGDLIDYYVFDGFAGQVVTVELMSDVLGHRLDEFDASLEILDPTFAPVTIPPIITGSIDGDDATAIDVMLPISGPYFIEVRDHMDAPPISSEYELLVYSMFAEPMPDVHCDFDGMNGCNIDDIDALVAEIVSGLNGPLFDLNGDGVVTLEDVTDPDSGWLRRAGEEHLGPGRSYIEADMNLDGVVDGVDFIEWNAHKFTSTGLWSAGDLNADGVTDGQDFIVWNTHKFTASDSLAVPEPATLLSGLLGLCLFVAVRPRIRHNKTITM